MKVELIGGPRDGEIVEITFKVIWQGEFYITTYQNDAGLTTASYRWLFGAPDHLDWAGYVK